MPYRPEAELKRPDLKGEFLCGHCGKTFCHAASLNRHRLNFHGDDQQCQLCNTKIAAHETVRRHMTLHHQINRVFTCGCCNWTFPDKKELHAHNNSMLRTGRPGEAKAIAISNRVPGSLAQAELRESGGVSPPLPKSASPSISSPAPKKRKVDGNGVAQSFYNQMLGAPSSNMQEWLQQFLLNNPNLLPMLASFQPQAVAMKQEEPSTSFAISSLISSPKTQEIVKVKLDPQSEEEKKPLSPLAMTTESCFKVKMEPQEEVEKKHISPLSMPSECFKVKLEPQDNFNVKMEPREAEENKPLSPLVVKTEPEEVCSGPESGIASGEEAATDPSPVPSESSKEGSPPLIYGVKKQPKKSVDAIASFLFKQKLGSALQC